MHGPTNSEGLAEPPEAAITGDSVPIENEEQSLYRPWVDELVGQLKAHPAYSGRSDAELREIAEEHIKNYVTE